MNLDLNTFLSIFLEGGGGGQNGLHRVIFYDLHFFDEDKTVDDFEEVLFTRFIVSIMIWILITQHVFGHHPFTNIDGVDPDISTAKEVIIWY